MTLVEFLLARIKDDEARLNSLRLRDGSWGDGFRRWAIPQMLTECEAKRQIICVFVPTADTEQDWIYADRIYARTGSGRYHSPLAALAGVYADHSDFDPSWRLSPDAPPAFAVPTQPKGMTDD